MEHAYFESLARDERCDYCAGRRQVTTLAPGLNAIYCISLQEQPHRTTKAAAQFHALGLCREALFYRPVRGRDADRAIWNSHRAVAQDAVAKGLTRILVLEDDVLFTQPRETLVRRITAALRVLPSSWWGLYLGHVPIQAYFLRPNLLRVRSGCTHAYIANTPLLAWLASTPPMSPEVPMWHWIGQSIDAAMSSLPEMYAMFPMIAVATLANPAPTRVSTIRGSRAYSSMSAVGATSSSMVREHASPRPWLYYFRRCIG
jgi:hypothetical protein